MTWNELFRDQWVGSDRPAIVTANFTLSGDELARRAGGAAAWLDALGFERGSFVLAQGREVIEYRHESFL